MNAHEFYNEFIIKTDEDREIDGKRLFEIYKSCAEFTPVITSIILDIIESAGYKSQKEYFRIDAVGWISHYTDMKSDAESEKLKINAHLWDLKIAVEHENSKTDWTDEVMKLIHVKCPLKVIIGYSYSDERGEMERRKLSFVSKWMQKVNALQKGKDEEYLIILGNGCNHATGESDYTSFDYKGYLYNWDNKEFEKIIAD